MYTVNASNLRSSVSTTPSAVYNYLRPNAFRFVIKDLPNVAYTCQSADIPSVQLGFATQPTPFIDRPVIGDKLLYSDFTIQFLIAEDMTNYIELHEWLVALGFPNNYNEYAAFTKERQNRFPFYQGSRGNTETIAYSDATLVVLNSNNIPKMQITFKDLFPVSVGSLDFNITNTSIEYFVGVASFKYRTFSIEAL